MRIWSLFGKAEKVALEFFKRKESDSCSKTANQIKKLFSSHDRYLDYILLEGSLKADLLKSGIFSQRRDGLFTRGAGWWKGTLPDCGICHECLQARPYSVGAFCRSVHRSNRS